MPPDARQNFQRNAQLWMQMTPEQRNLMRQRENTRQQIMCEYLTEALPKEQRYEVKKWDASIFNTHLMDKVEGALKSLAFR